MNALRFARAPFVLALLLTVVGLLSAATAAEAATPRDLHISTACRVYDSRLTGGPLASGAVRDVNIPAACAIPDDAVSVIVTLTVIFPPADGYIQVYKGGGPVPPANALSFQAGELLSQFFVVEVGPGPDLQVVPTIAGGGSTHFAIDVLAFNGSGAPTNVGLAPTNVLENQPVNTLVGNFSTTDPDFDDSFTYTLVAGTGDDDNGKFVISGTELRTNAVLDREGQTPIGQFKVRVRTADTFGVSFDGQLIVTADNVNDAPAGTDGSVSTPENTDYTFAAANFGFTDPGDSPANALQAVVITTLPAVGTLKLSNVAVTAGQSIPAASIPNLTFTPVTNGNGSPYATFTFQVQDDGGTANLGVDLDPTPNTLSINVNGVNNEPAGTNGAIAVGEDGSHTFVAADFGFTDPNDTPPNAFQAVTITTLPAAGSLTLSGSPVTAGQSIPVASFASFVFTPAANATGSPYTTFTFQVQDDGGTTGGGVDLDQSPNTLTANVTAVNDAPAGTNNAVTILEDVQHTFVAADFGFTDPNDTPANALQSVVITTLPAAGTLTLSGAGFAAGTEITLANITAGNLKFTPAANASGTPYTSFTFQVRDDGGTAGGGIDLDPSANTFTFNVTAVNDAPAGTNNTVATLEETQYTFTVADFGFTDPNDTPANALQSVVITTLPALGTLTLSGGGFAAGTEITAANITGGNLKFTPAANGFGAPYTSFTFQVRDDGGTANSGVDLDASPNTLSINVTGVNDPPAGTDNAVTTPEDAQYTLTVADFGFTDPLDSPANALQSVIITTLPGAGTLTLSGGGFAAGTEITAANITAGNLKFTPAANASGSPYTTFTFQVRDDGGTASGGIDLDASPNTITFNVTAVNDAPAGTDNTVTVAEDAQYTFTAADFGFTDPLDSPPNTLQSVVITTLPGAGSLTLSGGGFAAGTEISLANINGGNLRFTPAANASGSPYTTFTFQVRDNGGTGGGGIDLDATPNTMTVNVTPVNDPPAGTNNTVSLAEDTQYVFTAADFGFTDPNDSPANALQSVVITTLPGAGSLTLSGSGFAAGTEISLANITAGNLRFTPAANGFGSPYTTFTFQVRDDGGTAGGGIDLDASPNTMTLNVTAVNDAPAGTNNTITALEDGQYTLTVADFGFTDPLDSPPNTLQSVVITTLPGLGSLTLSGSGFAAGTEISLANITAGNLKFTPVANGSGSPYTTFTFQVRDNGGTAGGGIDLDATPNTMTVNVTAVNDAPAGTDNTVTTPEDIQYVFTAADFGFTDPIDVPANSFQSVVISTLPGAGSLTLSGSGFAAGTEISVANITAGNLRFLGAANAFGSPYASFTFRVRDNGGTGGGGVDLDPSANTMTINVTPVPDAPVAGDEGSVGTPYVETAGNTLLEVTASPSSTPIKVVFNGNVLTNDTDPDGPTVFTVTLESATAGAVVTVNGDGTFTYVPPAGFTGVDSFNYRITDPDLLFDIGTVFINVKHRVWYVKNNQAAGGLGRSTDPFDTLAEAETASLAGDTIYVFEGNATTLGQSDGITLKNGQRLLGEAVQLAVPPAVSINGTAGLTLRSTTGNKPQIENDNTPDAVGEDNGVSVPATAGSMTGVEIRGLDIKGFDNAIDVTATGANNAGVTISNVTVSGANLEGIDVNSGTTGTTTLAVSDNTLLSNGNAIDITRTNGTLLITGFANNAVSGNTGGSGIVVTGPVTFDSDLVTANLQVVSGGTTVIGQSGNPVGSTDTHGGLVLTQMTGSLSFTDLDIFSAGYGLSVGGTGVFTGSTGTNIQVTAAPPDSTGTSTITANAGAAVAVDNATVDLRFAGLTSTASTFFSTSGVDFVNVAGQFRAPSGSSITKPGGGGVAFHVDNSTAGTTVLTSTYGGTINNSSSAARSILINNADSGSSLSFSGQVTDTGQGISLTANTGATIAFTGPLTVSSGSSPAFNATGGGTVTATDTTSTLTTTTATALNVASTTIGAGGLSFRSISAGTAASGPASGIVLSTTGSGGLTVSGTGSAGSGGTIQRTTGPGISLTSASNVSLSWMNVQNGGDDGIRGSNVTGFTLNRSTVSANGNAAGEAGLDFAGLLGTASITNSTITGSAEDNAVIRNTSGTLNPLTVTGSTFSSNSSIGNDGLLIDLTSTASATVSVTSSTFTANRGDHFQAAAANSANLNVTFSGNTLTGGHASPLGQGITVNAATAVPGYSGAVTYTISGNSINGAILNAIQTNLGTSAAGATMVGTISNNTIGTVGSFQSCSTQGSGIAIDAHGNGTHTALISGNTIRQCFDRGITVLANDGSGTVNLTVTGNNASHSDGTNSREGFFLNAGSADPNIFGVADAHFVCLNLGGAGALSNTLTHGPGAPDDFRIRQRFNTTVRLPGYGGAATDTAAVVSYVISRNSATVGSATVSSPPGGGFVGGAACPVP